MALTAAAQGTTGDPAREHEGRVAVVERHEVRFVAEVEGSDSRFCVGTTATRQEVACQILAGFHAFLGVFRHIRSQRALREESPLDPFFIRLTE